MPKVKVVEPRQIRVGEVISRASSLGWMEAFTQCGLEVVHLKLLPCLYFASIIVGISSPVFPLSRCNIFLALLFLFPFDLPLAALISGVFLCMMSNSHFTCR